MTRRILTGSLSALGLLLLILDSKTALRGASAAIELCLYSVIPSIFPFLVLTGLLTSVICGTHSKILRPLSRLLGIPAGAEGIFLTGILGGYPTGAQTVHSAWKQGQLNTEAARRMLGFCSNAGPAFIFGILISAFPNFGMLWILWGIHILSAILTAVILPCGDTQGNVTVSKKDISLSQSLKNAVATMGYICGWILLFRIILAFCDRWILWYFPSTVRVVFYGITELANGCGSLMQIPSVGLRFVVASAILAFGGICVTMQTVTVVGELGLGKYFLGKVLQMLISLVLSSFVQMRLFPLHDQWHFSPRMIMFPIALLVLICYWQRKMKKRVAFLR